MYECSVAGNTANAKGNGNQPHILEGRVGQQTL